MLGLLPNMESLIHMTVALMLWKICIPICKWSGTKSNITVLQSKIGPKLKSKVSGIDLFQTRQSRIIIISILRAWLVFGGKSQHDLKRVCVNIMQIFFQPASFQRLLYIVMSKDQCTKSVQNNWYSVFCNEHQHGKLHLSKNCGRFESRSHFIV